MIMGPKVRNKVIDSDLLDVYIKKSGIKSSFIIEKMGISKQAYYNKLAGNTAFRLSEVYVLCDLVHIPDEEKEKIFYPVS